MFAGLPELFVILVVVFAAWHVVKMFNRANTRPPRAQRPPQAPPQARRIIEAEDLMACKSCGAYIAASARHCGRADCPQPR